MIPTSDRGLGKAPVKKGRARTALRAKARRRRWLGPIDRLHTSFLTLGQRLRHDADVLNSSEFERIEHCRKCLKWDGLIRPKVNALTRRIEQLLADFVRQFMNVHGVVL